MPFGRAIPLPLQAATKSLTVFSELQLNPFPIDLLLICPVNYVCYLCAVKLEAFTHSGVSTLKRKPVFYGMGEIGQISGNGFVYV